MRRVLCALIAPLAFAACGGTQPPTMAADLLEPPPAGKGVQFKMVATIEPGQEIEKCSFFVVPPEGYYFNKQTVRYTPGSHHVLLFTTPYKTIPTTDNHGVVQDTSRVVDCPEGAGGDWAIRAVVGGAQSADAPPIFDLPSDVAIKVAPGTVLLMNTHYLNATAKTLTTDARINIYTMPKEQMKHEAGAIFYYNPFIKVPGMSTGYARMRCPIKQDITIFNAQSHMHKRGDGYVAHLLDAKGAIVEELYNGNKWEDPTVKTWPGGKTIKAGSSIDYRCSYSNHEARTIMQGPTTKDEMCMFIGVYYPYDEGLTYCSPDTIGRQSMAATWFGTGAKSCSDFLDCVEKVGDPEKEQGAPFNQCIIDTCPSVAGEMSEVLKCLFTNGDGQCDAQCGKVGKDCELCLYGACKSQLTACNMSKCG
ncbi:MAG: hypothetical protein EXR72_05960 [Myxococcales bacterium]|nr:hypothetical protein [Myxococcales bacterium]